MYQYPYGNAQQLNLDWILSKLQEIESGSGGGADLEKVANTLVSASFDATIPYRRYDYAFYDGKLYRALNDTIGAFNPADWLEVTLGADIPVLTRLLNAVDASLTTLQGQVADLDSDDVDNASNVTGTTVTAALDNLNGAINDLTANDIANNSNVSGNKVKDALNTLDSALSQIGTVIMGSDVTNELRNAQVEEIRTATLTNGTWLLFGYVTFTEYFSQRASIYILNGSATLAQFNGTGDFGGPVSCFAAFVVNDNLGTKDIKLKIYQTSGATQYVNAGRLTCVKLK